MARSLYELLEVSETASNEVIHAAYVRLSDKLKSNLDMPDAEIRLKAIHDAYKTLTDPQSRKRYDASLASKYVEYEEVQPFWTLPKVLLLLAIVLIAGTGYLKHSRDVEREKTERARIEAERAENERLAQEAALEAQATRLAREDEMRQKADAARLQAQLDRERQSVEYSAASAARQDVYERQRIEREQRNEQQRADAEQRRREQEARYQADLEKRKLRELEYQNRTNRPAVISVPR